MSLLKPKQMPSASPRRIICHWTAGAYKASADDRKHYHFLIEDDGKIIDGTRTIKDNDSTADGKYAAHTLKCNTKAIGLSVCCMADATRENPGRFPMTEVQWRTMAQVAAELCRHYKIKITSTTVLGHFEVQRNLNIQQRGKWDPGFLPWEPTAGDREIGDRFRALVQSFLDGDQEQDETEGADAAVAVRGKKLNGAIETNEETHVPVKALVKDLGWTIPYANGTHTVLDTKEKSPKTDEKVPPIYLAFTFLEDRVEIDEDATEIEIIKLVTEKGYVLAKAIAEELDLPIELDEQSDVLEIGEKSKAGKPGFEQVVVRRGDTLAKISATHLSNGSRWRELRKPNGKPFTDADARRLQPGQVVLVPTIGEQVTAPAAVEPANEPPADLMDSNVDIDLLVNAAQSGFRRFAGESIPVVLAECISSGVMMPEQIAYVLATSEHESGCGRWMEEIWGPTRAQRRYEGRTDLGNTQPGDGFRFRGRGYVQITGRHNYRNWARRLGLDIESRPDLVANDPSLAARILVRGMRDGTFRRKKLADYFREGQAPDFFNARDIINGDKHKNGEKITGHAKRYLAALQTTG